MHGDGPNSDVTRGEQHDFELYGVAVLSVGVLAAFVVMFLPLFGPVPMSRARNAGPIVQVRIAPAGGAAQPVPRPAPPHQPSPVVAKARDATGRAATSGERPAALGNRPAVRATETAASSPSAKAGRAAYAAATGSAAWAVDRARRATDQRFASSYEAELLDHIARYQHYPEEAVRQGAQGVVLVIFVMDRDGLVLGLWIKRTSGQPLLDNAAAATVRQAQPLPAIPLQLPGRLTVQLPVAYSISDTLPDGNG